MVKEAVGVQFLIVIPAPPMLLLNVIPVQLAFILLGKQFAKHVSKAVTTARPASQSRNKNATHAVMDIT